MQVFARHSLVPLTLPADAPALLLEGSWPNAELSGCRWSLDDCIDARQAWIDESATEMSEHLGATQDGSISLAWLNALPLRYYLVKLLRVVAFFDEIEAGRQCESIKLHFTLPRDADYLDLVNEIACRKGLALQVLTTEGELAPPTAPPKNSLLRRLAAWCNERIKQRPLVASDAANRSQIAGATNGRGFMSQRVLLCGNPRILDPVCAELVHRGCRVAWLYDRFAFGSFWRWRRRGVRQLVCQSSLGRRNSLDATIPPISCHGVDLTRPIERWLSTISAQRGAQQSRLLEQSARHFAEFRPTHLVLDEDATPLARAAVAMARRQSTPSIVVQHGAPYVRLGYAPLAADRICVWGEPSRDRLMSWGLPADRIVITGGSRGIGFQPVSAGAGSLTGRMPIPRDPFRVLLLATVPPSDNRPDSVAFHLTRRTHAEMLRMACAAVAQIPGAELLIKLHPRCRDPRLFVHIAREFPSLRCQLAKRGRPDALLQRATCVLNCCSSAGIEATQSGVPVIELLPEGCDGLLSAGAWGHFGSAGSLPGLSSLLEQVLRGRKQFDLPTASVKPSRRRVLHAPAFVRTGQSAVQAVVDAVLKTKDVGWVESTSTHPTPADEAPNHEIHEIHETDDFPRRAGFDRSSCQV